MEAEPSNEASRTPYMPDPPTTPTNLVASDDTHPYGLSVAVQWDPSVSDFLSGYEVFRKADGEGEFTQIGAAGASTTPSHMDKGLTAGVTYTYCVRGTH